MLRPLRWEQSILSPMFALLCLKRFITGRICLQYGTRASPIVSLQVTRDCKILRVIAIISGSRVLSAAKEWTLQNLNFAKASTNKKLTFNWDDKLWDDWKYFGTSLFKHVENSLNSEESVWVLLFTNTFEENGKVMVIIQLENIDFPCNSVLGTMFN